MPKASTLTRCENCKGYLCPAVEMTKNMTWICPICHTQNYLKNELSESEKNQLSSNCYETIATADYISRLPAPPTFLIIIDCTQSAIESGFVAEICKNLHYIVENNMISGGDRSKIAILTYDEKNIHYYLINKNCKQPSLIISDFDCPIPVPIEKYFCDFEDCKSNLLTLFDSLPKSFILQSKSDAKISKFLIMLEKAEYLLKKFGGKILFFQSESSIADIVFF